MSSSFSVTGCFTQLINYYIHTHIYSYEYHQNTANKVIHFVFVPVLTFSLMMLLYLVPLDLPVIGDLISPFLRPTLATWVALLLCTYYLLLSVIPGLILTGEFVGMLLLSEWLLHTMSSSNYIWLALACQIIGWITQFVGHGVFEKRRPALTDVSAYTQI